MAEAISRATMKVTAAEKMRFLSTSSVQVSLTFHLEIASANISFTENSSDLKRPAC